MLELLRSMPGGVRVLLGYAFLLLTFLSLTLSQVIDQAIEAPISPMGLLWMLLLAYLIFTMTLVLQRKQAAYPLSIGLASLSLPLIPLLWLAAGSVGAVAGVIVTVIVFGSLRRRNVRPWFTEP